MDDRQEESICAAIDRVENAVDALGKQLDEILKAIIGTERDRQRMRAGE